MINIIFTSLYKMDSVTRLDNPLSIKTPLSLSAIVNETSNFVLERYVRQAEMDICKQHPNFKGSPDVCACVLSGAKDMETCAKGFSDVRVKYEDVDTRPFEPLVWCVKNVNAMAGSNTKNSQDSWLLGCINGVRK